MSIDVLMTEISSPLIDLSRPGRSGVLLRGVFLTPREWDIARLVAEGMTNRMIARELGMPLSTTKLHLSHVCSKIKYRFPQLGAHDRRVLLGVWSHHAICCGDVDARSRAK